MEGIELRAGRSGRCRERFVVAMVVCCSRY